MIELEVLGCKPFVPVRLLDEFTTSEFIDAGDHIENPPIINNPVGGRSSEVFGHRRKFPSVIKLIMNMLCKEWGRRYNG